jgi:hypothetical protein
LHGGRGVHGIVYTFGASDGILFCYIAYITSKTYCLTTSLIASSVDASTRITIPLSCVTDPSTKILRPQPSSSPSFHVGDASDRTRCPAHSHCRWAASSRRSDHQATYYSWNSIRCSDGSSMLFDDSTSEQHFNKASCL